MQRWQGGLGDVDPVKLERAASTDPVVRHALRMIHRRVSSIDAQRSSIQPQHSNRRLSRHAEYQKQQLAAKQAAGRAGGATWRNFGSAWAHSELYREPPPRSPDRRESLKELAARPDAQYIYRTSCYGAHAVMAHKHSKIMADGSKAPDPTPRSEASAELTQRSTSSSFSMNSYGPGNIPKIAPNTSLGQMDDQGLVHQSWDRGAKYGRESTYQTQSRTGAMVDSTFVATARRRAAPNEPPPSSARSVDSDVNNYCFKVGDSAAQKAPQQLRSYNADLRRRLYGDDVGNKFDSTNQCRPWRAATQNKAHWLKGRQNGALSPFVPFEKQH